MLQPQGPRGFEPYRILQLQPQAPQELIVEAYWTLVGRAKEHDNQAAIRALNAAYELLTNAERRSAYDREQGYTRDEPDAEERKGRKERKNGWKAAPDHYRALAVDRDADIDLIHVAYRIAMRRASGYQPDLVLLREQLTEAYHTLSNTQLRAQYDTTIGVVQFPGGHVDAPPPPPTTPAPPSAVPDFLANGAGPRGDAVKAKPERKRRGLLGMFGPREKKDVEAGALPPPPTPKMAEETARGDRLLQLRPFGAEVLVGSMRKTPVPEQPPMAVLSVRGPQGEERVPLPPRTITIGSAEECDIILPGRRVAPEQARMWPHGDTFALRVTSRGSVRIGGAEPSLEVVLLEDGDTIELSDYRMTFHNAPRE